MSVHDLQRSFWAYLSLLSFIRETWWRVHEVHIYSIWISDRWTEVVLSPKQTALSCCLFVCLSVCLFSCATLAFLLALYSATSMSDASFSSTEHNFISPLGLSTRRHKRLLYPRHVHRHKTPRQICVKKESSVIRMISKTLLSSLVLLILNPFTPKSAKFKTELKILNFAFAKLSKTKSTTWKYCSIAFIWMVTH